MVEECATVRARDNQAGPMSAPLIERRHLEQHQQQIMTTGFIEKSVIIHKDENGFGLRIKGQAPVFIEHVHENGAAWRAGVRALDTLCKVNGVTVCSMDHKDVVLLFKSCSRFVALTLLSASSDQLLLSSPIMSGELSDSAPSLAGSHSRQASTYSQRVYHHYQLAGADRTLPQLMLSGGYSAHARRLSGVSAAANFAGLMDRTSSCRSSAASARQELLANIGSQDSEGDSGSAAQAADKRLAVCICCRNSIESEKPLQPQQQQQAATTGATCAQCQLSYQRAGHDSELTRRQLLHGGLKESLVRHLLAADSALPASRLVRGSPSSAVEHAERQGPGKNNENKSNIRSGGVNNNKFVPSSASIRSLPAQQGAFRNGRPGAMTSSNQHGACPAPTAAAINYKSAQVSNTSSSSNNNNNNNNNKRPQIVNKRLEIIREFIDTERTHTERLRCLDELFYRPLRESGFVSSEQLAAVFSSHRTLYKIHKQIYRILMSAASCAELDHVYYSREPLVGSALLEIFEGELKRRLERASCSFCAAQATNSELLKRLTRRDTKAGELLADITSQRMVGRLGIKDLLASCFQRLTKYPLLLENLLKATPQSVPDDDDDDAEDELAEVPGFPAAAGHRRRSKSGLSVLQRRARLRMRLSVDDELDGASEERANREGADDEENEDQDDEDRAEQEEEETETETEEEEEDEAARRNTRRMMAISLAEEREFIERALAQSRAMLVRVNESIRVALARTRLKEIWKRTDKYPGVPLIDITKQQVIHEGLLTLRLSKRSFDVYVLLLNNYIIILTREGQDKYRLKFFTPEGKSSALSSNSTSVGSFITSASASISGVAGGVNGSIGGTSSGTSAGSNSVNSCATGGPSSAGNGASNLANFSTPLQTVYSPVFVIDEHLTTRDAATDENGFYLLCKRKDDSRIYEFASRSPAERIKWREKIQSMIERQMGRSHRRASCESGTLAKPSSEFSATGAIGTTSATTASSQPIGSASKLSPSKAKQLAPDGVSGRSRAPGSRPATPSSEPTKIVGTISYVFDDGIVLPSKMESSRVLVDQAIQVNILDSSTTMRAAQQGTLGSVSQH